MQIKFIKSTWGMTEDCIWEKLEKIIASGYNGVETHVPEDVREREMLKKGLKEFDLLFVAQQWTSGNNITEHKKSFKTQFIRNIELEPLLVNSHTGKDFYSTDANLEIIDFAEELAQKYSVKVIHETHRGRFSYSAKSTSEYLRLRPGIRLAADFSHWCCVSESLLHDQSESVDLAIKHADHIHARVGFSQGPQINDPRAPEWNDIVELYLNWWQKIIDHHVAMGTEYLTITPEFGPYPYMPLEPYTRKPLADLWEINLFMKEKLSQRFSEFI